MYVSCFVSCERVWANVAIDAFSFMGMICRIQSEFQIKITQVSFVNRVSSSRFNETGL